MPWIAGALAVLWVAFALFGRRWRIEPRLRAPDDRDAAQRVVAVVPARNEATELPESLRSLLQQDHPALEVLLVDDHSEDGTGELARRIAAGAKARAKLDVLVPAPLPEGWAGKVWAQREGVERGLASKPDWIWLADADIQHEPDVLRRLLATARAEDRDLVSVMARLRTERPWERLLIPAFGYFFACLYPFRAIARDGSRAAGAAGGCILVKREVLERIGGMAAIRGAIIDDVAFARACKAAGARLWLGYHAGLRSTRGYQGLGGIWSMVARSAYTQLGYSPLALLGCVLGLAAIFLFPVGALALGEGPTRWLGLAACAGMVRSYLPMVLHLDRREARAARLAGALWALALPLAASLYAAITVSSAWRHHRGAGVAWKGRRLGR